MKVGIVFSTFDLFHIGHIKLLEFAKSKCNYLIVGLHIDPSIERNFKNKPVQSIVERYVQLDCCKNVDEIIPYSNEKELLDILKTFKIDLTVVGEEYKNNNFTHKKYCINNNIKIYYNKRNHDFSSSLLRKKIMQLELDKL
tara:strand:+ start:7289 stop:7711 length:423 start_codon:yes stop_codon:yes gene_type:complete